MIKHDGGHGGEGETLAVLAARPNLVRVAKYTDLKEQMPNSLTQEYYIVPNLSRNWEGVMPLSFLNQRAICALLNPLLIL